MALTIAMILLFQTTIGILGNFSLILHYIFLHFSGCRSKPTDLILTHLTVANSLAILCKGIPETMLAFGLTCHVNKVGCHSFSFLDRVGRGVSVCTTCLLSVFQVITINPLHSRWAGLKLKVFKYIGPCNIMNWILHMMVNAIFPIYASTKWINKTIAKENMSKCCTRNYDNVTFSLYVTFISFHDVLCLGFMSWASASVVFILYKHKQQVQHIYNHKITPRSSAETRATKKS
ncbi:PREDICTED: vomeronasal type-1 receptor 2-like [Elephantulus edwardii]|uniref:vomeronasal type-1 receptor 2-like n=1 Tax=Elephantulus edwardii TaxID=28737 RepID=UPI0003F0C5BF|nr:PREDICTED: vomeronasal type-1 receptor 2-like [Elephantulus edwardii]